MVLSLTVQTTALADRGGAEPTLSFFSGGNGAHADWLVTSDQPPGDTDNQAIRLLTTNGAPSFAKGYAGILVHHVTGIPAADFPDSSFWNKTPDQYIFEPYTQGSPRLVVTFQNAAGKFDGYGALRENVRGNDWEEVSDQTNYPNAAWDVMGGPCGFRYNVMWTVVQSCFAGHTTLSVYIVADAYGIYHLIDDITVNGKTFSSASDNSNGSNDPAGPLETLDLSLLPPLPLPDLPKPALGTAANFAVLAGTAVTCTNSSITGDVGSSAPASVVQTGCTITGTIHAGDAVAPGANNDFLSTYSALAAKTCDQVLTGTLAGVTLAPGVYCFDGAATSTGGALTLSGPSNGTWIFKIGTSGTGALTGTNFSVVRADGAQPSNVYWWVAEAATMTDSQFVGTMLSGAAITITGGTFAGNALAKAAVTMTGTTLVVR